mgnify:CR=1 FL=1
MVDPPPGLPPLSNLSTSFVVLSTTSCEHTCPWGVATPFHVRYDAFSQTVHVDRAVRRKEYYPVLQTG